MSETVTELLKLGILGPILVALGYLFVQESKKYKEAQEARIAEQKVMTETLVKVNDQTTKAILLITSALEAQEEITDTMKTRLDDVHAKVKELEGEIEQRRRR